MNSGSNVRKHPLHGPADVRKMCEHYDELFQLASQVFQKVIYVKSPPAEYWKVSNPYQFERILEQAVFAAKRYGAMFVEGI
eukprot:165720-Lingulodinium_polyedra.AAC.1